MLKNENNPLPFDQGFIGQDKSPQITLRAPETVLIPKSLVEYSKDYTFFVLNTLHIYLRLNQNLFEKYCSEFNTTLNPIHFELPTSLINETLKLRDNAPAPPPGWSRYVQGLPNEQWPDFKAWLLASGWISRDAKNRPTLYNILEEKVDIQDPVKLQSNSIATFKDRVSIHFFLPGNGSGRIYLNTKSGPPFSVSYISRTNVKDHVDPFGVNLDFLE